AGATTIAVDRGFPSSAPRSAENDLPTANAAGVAHPPDPSSPCVPAWFESPPHRRSTTQSSAQPAIVQTSGRVHSLPFPRALSVPAPPALGRTSPLPRGAATAVPGTLQYRYPQTQSAGNPGGNLLLK